MASIYYDGTCGFCLATVRRVEPMLARRGFRLVPLQSPGTARLLGVSEDRLLDEMRVRRDDGSVVGGSSSGRRDRPANLVGVAAVRVEPPARCDDSDASGLQVGRAQPLLHQRRVRGSA
jgi:hypothetical protein